MLKIRIGRIQPIQIKTLASAKDFPGRNARLAHAAQNDMSIYAIWEIGNYFLPASLDDFLVFETNPDFFWQAIDINCSEKRWSIAYRFDSKDGFYQPAQTTYADISPQNKNAELFPVVPTTRKDDLDRHMRFTGGINGQQWHDLADLGDAKHEKLQWRIMRNKTVERYRSQMTTYQIAMWEKYSEIPDIPELHDRLYKLAYLRQLEAWQNKAVSSYDGQSLDHWYTKPVMRSINPNYKPKNTDTGEIEIK